VTHILGFFLSITIAIFIGFGATWLVVGGSHSFLGHVFLGHGFSRIDTGAWSTWTKAGSFDADPYTKAIIARSGEIPLQAAEGLALVSQKDNDGAAFKPTCTYVISGSLPAARLWVIAAYTLDGQLIANSALRYSFTSHEIIRDVAGHFEITLSASVQSGNWLPVHPTQPFKLILRLYDPSVGRTAPEIQASIMLTNKKKNCI
jgi:hypothetical protein